MFRNHLMDPESPEKKVQNSSSAFGKPAAPINNFSFAAQNDDPWYTDSGRESPMGTGYGGYNDPSIQQQYQYSGEDFENELPLLEELGIRFDHIWAKTQAVMNPTKRLSEQILDDADLAGPIFFCLILGSCLLFYGKVQFSYIYGFSVFGCFAMQALLNLMNSTGIDFWRTCSVLGYGLIPVILLAVVGVLLALKSLLGVVLSVLAIAWSTYSATRLFDARLSLSDQYWLVAYPIMLLYSCFVLITIF